MDITNNYIWCNCNSSTNTNVSHMESIYMVYPDEKVMLSATYLTITERIEHLANKLILDECHAGVGYKVKQGVININFAKDAEAPPAMMEEDIEEHLKERNNSGAS